MPSHLLDTSVLSQPVKDKPLVGVLQRWDALGDSSVCTSAICLAELLQGLEERGSEKYWRRYRHLLENRYAILAFDEGVASEYSRLSAQLRRSGRPKPALDLLIAATAKRYGLILATLNSKDFLGMPGVAVEDWLE